MKQLCFPLRRLWCPILAISMAAFGAENQPSSPADNLLKNPEFAEVDAKGVPAMWQDSHNASSDQTLTATNDPTQKHCLKLACTRFVPARNANAMLSQKGAFAVKAGEYYRFHFWAKGEGIDQGVLNSSLSDTRTYEYAAQPEGFRVTEKWKEFTFYYYAKASVPAEAVRLQIWWQSTGTLWIAHPSIAELDSVPLKYFPEVAVEERKNLLPNSSFECGKSGWGGIGPTGGWGRLNDLLGEIDTTAAQHGSNSLKITVSDQAMPMEFFDWFELTHARVRTMLAANVGWIPVEKGADYTFSAWLKADREGVPAVLEFYFGRSPVRKKLTLSTEWKRHTFTLAAAEDHCFVAAGPDLSASSLPEATVWIDALQLEKGGEATEYETADPVEVAIEEGPESHIFTAGSKPTLRATVHNGSADKTVANLTVLVTDFFGARVANYSAIVAALPGRTVSASLVIPVERMGYYDAAIHVKAGARTRDSTRRLAVIAPYAPKDSFWGMNHTFPWDELVRQARQAGLCSMRDWSAKWHEVEPEQGRFDFTEADRQIDRPLALDEQVLVLLPHPAARWSGTTPPVPPKKIYAYDAMATMPRNLNEFSNYVETTVRHYASKTKWFEILNEPLDSSYSLPAVKGYKPKDYVTVLKAAYAAAKKADPQCVVVGGPAGNAPERYDEYFKEGCLDGLDVLNFHVYPGLKPPEWLETRLAPINEAMRKAGKLKPIWATEFAYFADDHPSVAPYDFSIPRLENEKLLAAYIVRGSVVMLANNVTRIFYHAAAAGTLNLNVLSEDDFIFDYASAPRKVYSAQAAMANLLPAGTTFSRRIPTRTGLRAYAFENADGAVIVAWAEADHRGNVKLTGDALQPLDLEGNPLKAKNIVLTEFPVYLAGRGLRAAEAAQALNIEPAPQRDTTPSPLPK
jgi:hypothetical protein